MSEVRVASPSVTSGAYTVADYLLDRLAELGVDHAFGVPGDYNLAFLDHVSAHPSVDWVGCANELNAGYAADAYGRLRGVAALFTTFGVGELSAVNALAGSYAEQVPVIAVVGAPATASQAAHRIVHHSLGDGVFTHFMGMHESITCARAALTAETAVSEIDRVLAQVHRERLPGYLLVPSDVAEVPVAPPSTPLPERVDVTDPAALAAFTRAVSRLLASASDAGDVTFLTGLLVHRLGAAPAYRQLLATHPVRFATSAWAKSIVDETAPGYVGLYAGAASEAAARAAVEEAPVLVVAGVQFTDLNSGFFTQTIARERTVELGAATASVGHETFAPVSLTAALDVLGTALADVPAPPVRAVTVTSGTDAGQHQADTVLTQDVLWSLVAAHLDGGDIVLADQGTSFYGMATHSLPAGAIFMGQPLWASIGYTLPAVLGAARAEPDRRAVLLIGDGAALMTVQELATMARRGLTPLVLVVDNDGYTVERAIHGPEETYNDIPRIDWLTLVRGLAPEADLSLARVTTAGELAQALDAALSQPRRMAVVQAVLPPLDVPALLTAIAEAAAAANRRPTITP